MTVTIDATTGNRRLQFLEDYCPRCSPVGDQADRPARLATLTPTSITAPGGNRLVCAYGCVRCGRQWRRSDLWTAQDAGLSPGQTRKAA